MGLAPYKIGLSLGFKIDLKNDLHPIKLECLNEVPFNMPRLLAGVDHQRTFVKCKRRRPTSLSIADFGQRHRHIYCYVVLPTPSFAVSRLKRRCSLLAVGIHFARLRADVREAIGYILLYGMRL